VPSARISHTVASIMGQSISAIATRASSRPNRNADRFPNPLRTADDQRYLVFEARYPVRTLIAHASLLLFRQSVSHARREWRQAVGFQESFGVF